MATRSFRFAILFAIAAMVSGLRAQESRADIEPDTLPIEVELAKPLLKGGGGYAYWEGWSKDQNNDEHRKPVRQHGYSTSVTKVPKYSR